MCSGELSCVCVIVLCMMGSVVVLCNMMNISMKISSSS